jgi:hypothetical protein
MPSISFSQWTMIIISTLTLAVSFLIFYRDTENVGSSLVAATLSSALTLGSLIVLNWFAQALKK